MISTADWYIPSTLSGHFPYPNPQAGKLKLPLFADFRLAGLLRSHTQLKLSLLKFNSFFFN